MAQASCNTTIERSADDIWEVISGFGAADQYLSGVVACTVRGAGIGALRTLTSADGSTILERLEALNSEARQLSYALLTDTPFRDCLTTMTVREVTSVRAELEWSSFFQPAGIPVTEAAEMLEDALWVNCAALKQFMER